MITSLIIIYSISVLISLLMFSNSITRKQVNLLLKYNCTNTQYAFAVLLFSLFPVLNTFVAYISLKTIIKTAFK